ncbi:hypothetical protein LEN26_020193 [Aphanomyces euteiches]|nr:hypothetical protein LEN26_020193 [Aphanomyces euteiches]KAH9102422.1 hypothetical protein AeMF1_020982 [Aphanomyces euteiches]KAH9193050.1 hypothetical protein AeNC1_004979 [Aphanomyces euteiches]
MGDASQTCAACHRQSAKLLVCGQCKLARFCSSACQRQIWKAHKPICVAISNPHVDMLKSPGRGNGLFATKSFRRGELIVMEKSQNISKRELAQRGMLEQFGYTLSDSNSDETVAIHGPILSLVNHACIPNTWVKREAGPYRKLYARRDIAAGEELCSFYDGRDDPDEECCTPSSRAAKRTSLLERFGLTCVCTHCQQDSGNL